MTKMTTQEDEPELSSLGAIEELHQLIVRLSAKVRQHPNFDNDGRRGPFAALSGTDWSDRSSGWFPKDPLQLPKLTMRRASYNGIKDALLRERDKDGSRIVTENEIEALDAAYKRYEETQRTKGTKLDFWRMLQGIDPNVSAKMLEDCEGFRYFLLHNIYECPFR